MSSHEAMLVLTLCFTEKLALCTRPHFLVLTPVRVSGVDVCLCVRELLENDEQIALLVERIAPKKKLRTIPVASHPMCFHSERLFGAHHHASHSSLLYKPSKPGTRTRIKSRADCSIWIEQIAQKCLSKLPNMSRANRSKTRLANCPSWIGGYANG